MILYILLAIVFIVGLGVAIYFFSNWEVFFGIFLGFLCIWGLGGGAAIGITYAISTSIVSNRGDASAPLAALGNSSETTGSFFLGSGYVKDKLTFSYVTKDSKGGYHLQQIDADKVTVYEDAKDGEAKIVWHESQGDNWWLYPSATGWKVDSTEFHVPKGSVDSQYQVSVSGK